MNAVKKFKSINLGRTSVNCRVGWSLTAQCSLVKPDMFDIFEDIIPRMRSVSGQRPKMFVYRTFGVY